MNEQDKQLLLQDLCARLPYGVNVEHLLHAPNNPSRLFGIDMDKHVLYCVHKGREEWYKVDFVTSYLRPMSSMTKEEATTIATLWGFEDFTSVDVTDDCVLVSFGVEFGSEHAAIMFSQIVASVECLDYLNSIHVDYRGLIPKGLALPAPEGMYDLKEG